MNQKIKEELLRPLIQAKKERQRWWPKHQRDNTEEEEDMERTKGPLHIRQSKKSVSLYNEKGRMFCSFTNKHYAPDTEQEEQWRAQAWADAEFIKNMYENQKNIQEANTDLAKKCDTLYQSLKYAVIEWESPDKWMKQAFDALEKAEEKNA